MIIPPMVGGLVMRHGHATNGGAIGHGHVTHGGVIGHSPLPNGGMGGLWTWGWGGGRAVIITRPIGFPMGVCRVFDI